jgi:hypothetical protein
VLNNQAPAPKKASNAGSTRTVAHSGDRVSLVEQQTPKIEDDQDLQNILYLAGMTAKAH